MDIVADLDVAAMSDEAKLVEAWQALLKRLDGDHHMIARFAARGARRRCGQERKTTTIGKLAHRYNEGKSVLLAAGDTFQAGAIEQVRV